MRRGALLPALAGSMLLTACGAGGASAPPTASAPSTPESAPVSVSVAPPSPATTVTGPGGTTAPPAGAPAGIVVVLDPGHDGGNAAHPAEIDRQVPAGRGQTKACNTTGASTNAGYPEHAFTFDVAKRVGSALAARGIRVVYTRDSDTGVGPCVDERAAIGNSAHANAVVSIHADGSNSAGARGFHVEYSAPPLNAAQGEPSTKLATTLRDGLRSAGLTTANYIGREGLFGRSDLGGLNLSTRPAALIECGNMRDTADAGEMTSAEGRQRYAAAIAAAIEAYVGV